jgi:Mg-chelatase subunit ChlD
MAFVPKRPLSLTEKLEAAKAAQGNLQTVSKSMEDSATPKSLYVEVKDARKRYRIIFDDSGSMAGSKLADAKAGTIEFLKNCTPNDTAVGIHPLNMEAIPMDTNLPVLAKLIETIQDSGGTPGFRILQEAQRATPAATNYIIFTDGDTSDGYSLSDAVIATAKRDKTPVDVVLIVENQHDVDKEDAHHLMMKRLADETGGIFLVFDRTKVNFRDAFKYLSPGLRGMLGDGSFKANLEAGKIK